MMLTDCQQVILWALFIAPEDPKGFKKLQLRENAARWRKTHPEAAKESYLKYHNNHKESRLARARDRKKLNPVTEKGREQIREWYRKNRRYAIGRTTRYKRERCRIDPAFRLGQRLRKRVWAAMNGIDKSARTFELLGCTVAELFAHLEKQSKPGMTRENYGPVWHVDHVRPCASFDLTIPEQQRECFHFSNLQPLFAKENLKKGDKII